MKNLKCPQCKDTNFEVIETNHSSDLELADEDTYINVCQCLTCCFIWNKIYQFIRAETVDGVEIRKEEL